MNSIKLMKQCPKSKECGANICPMDLKWRTRAHLNGERVCIYLREYYKKERSYNNIPPVVLKALEIQAEKIIKKFSDIKYQVKCSSNLPSKITIAKKRFKGND